MSFDALTFAGLFSVAICCGLLITMMARTGVSHIRGWRHIHHS